MKLHLMKATLLLSSLLLLFFSSFSQNNYIEANSVSGVEVRQGGGSGSICPTYKSEFSINNTNQQFFFTAIECSASYLKFEIFNNTSGAVKVTIKNQSGTSTVETRVIAAGNSTGQMLLPTYAVNYLWKFETSTIPTSFVNDAVSMDSNVGTIFQPKNNDIAVPVNTGYRLKAGQTLTIANISQNVPNLSELIISSVAVGTQTVVLQAYNTVSNAVIGENNLSITINAPCSFSISNVIQAGLQTHNVTLSSNRTTRPYFYQVINSQNLVVKNGNTPANNLTNTELIEVGDIPSGNYTLRMVSTSQSLCGEVSKTFSHINSSDICSMNGTAVRSLNNYVITLPVIVGVLAYDFVWETPSDSVVSQGVANGITKILDFTGKQDGIYTLFLKPSNSTKICSQSINLVWTNVNSSNSRGYLKKYNNAQDYYEIAGSGDYGGVKDGGTGWVVRENRTVLIWQTFTKALSNSPNARAIITIREDSSSTARHISIAALSNKIQVVQRPTKSGSNLILAELAGTNLPLWLRIERNGNAAVLKYSTAAPTSDDPTWITLGTVQNAFQGWKPNYYKGLYTTSANINNLVSAEFHRFLGGLYTGTDNLIDNTPLSAPIITASNLNPTANASVTLTSSACKSGYLIQFYKNGVSSYVGSPYTVTATYGDSYKAKCEKGTDKSAFSNTIAFNAPASEQLCGITDKLLLGQKTAYGQTYSMYARIFGGKLWLTQSLGTTPESFLVRGINLLEADFVKSWTGNDYSCFEGQTTGYGGNLEPAGFSTPSGYSLTTQPDGAKIYSLGVPVPDGGGGTTTSTFANNTKLVPIETISGKYNPDAFPTISVINTTDPVVNKLFPNWSISWKVEGNNFKNSTRNNKTPKLGIPFMFDMLPVPYGGYGERCVDFIYPQNPSNGEVWQSDEACIGSQFNQYYNNLAHTNANFSSALPFQERAGDGGGAGLDRITEWNGISDLAYFYNQGTIGAERFGMRDWVNGKANIGLSDYDNEGTHDDNKSLAILLGLASKSEGYVFDQYANILGSVYIDPSQYPNDFNNPSSTYPQYTQLINETNGEPNSGGNALRTNNVPVRGFWNPLYKISIPSKFSGQKGINDEPTILPSTEVSCISSATFRQGESYVYNTIGSTRVVNKFGLNANTQHMIARTIFAAETHKWYCVNRLNNRKMIIQAKILCDQQQNGLLLDQNYTNTYITNPSLANKHFDREFGFDIGAFVAFSGCEWNIWDRNQQNVNLDGYHGAFGIINLLNQRKTFGTESKSFVDLKPTAKFLLWTSEISYDGGNTYVKDKANHYVMNSTKIPQRQFITPTGYWGGFLARPENTEATSCKLRVTYNGQYYYYTVTADMWETVDYNSRNIALSALPNDKKDYHYFLIKLGSPVVEGGTVQAPVINSNPSNPTAGTSVTFSTSSSCSGTIKWYSGDAQVSSGTSYTVTNPVANDSYNATCTANGVSSGSSNAITIATAPINSAVTVTIAQTSPNYYSGNQPASFWNNRNNLPSIFTNVPQFVESTDVVKMKNSQIEIWIDLKAGGQICYASLAHPNPAKNLVYIGYDRGFQWQADYTQHLANGTLNGQPPGDPNNNSDYNTTQGGDYQGHGVHLLNYYVTTDGFYTKTRPILYNFSSILSQVEIETTYKLVGNMLKANYRYTSFRTDGSLEVNNPFRFKGFDVPVMFCLEEYSKYGFYDGSNPWTNAPLSEGNIPNLTQGGLAQGANSTERWGMVWNPSNNQAIGVFNKSVGGTQTNLTWRQMNKYGGSGQGTNTSGPYTVMSLSDTEAVPDGGNYVHESEAWITFGNKSDIRGRFEAIRNN